MKLISIYAYKNEPKLRLKVKKGSILHTVFIEPLFESYQQYGAYTDILWFTLPIAEKMASTKYFQRFKKGKDMHEGWSGKLMGVIN